MRKQEAITPKEVVESLLRAAGPRLILVGGQALAFWMDRYGVKMPRRIGYVSLDIDFLTESAADVEEVYRLAGVLGGQAVIPKKRSQTALVGQAVREVSDDSFLNVDVIFRVLGGSAGLRARAVETHFEDFVFKVMHPIDVFKSRLHNLYQLAEKQTDLGKAQLEAAIQVIQRFLCDVAAEPIKHGDRSAVLKYVAFIEKMALSDAGRKVAARFGLHVADAIEPSAVRSEQFRHKKLLKLLPLMSNARRAQLIA